MNQAIVSKINSPYLRDMPETRGPASDFGYSLLENYIAQVALQVLVQRVPSYDFHPGKEIFIVISEVGIVTGPWRLGDQYVHCQPLRVFRNPPVVEEVHCDYVTFFRPSFPTKGRPKFPVLSNRSLHASVPRHFGISWDDFSRELGLRYDLIKSIRGYKLDDKTFDMAKSLLCDIQSEPQHPYAVDFLPTLPKTMDVAHFREDKHWLRLCSPGDEFGQQGRELVYPSVRDMEKHYEAMETSDWNRNF